MAKPDPKALAKAIADSTSAANPTSSGSLYGLPSEAQNAQFDVSGLPGLGSGQMKGSDVLRAFLAAGQSPDPQVRSIAAAIQHALYYGNYYGKSSVPTFGEVSKDDADALGRALNDLYNANQAQTGGSSSGQLTKMGVSQFLTSQAAIGATSGPNGPSSAVAPQVVNVRAPNAADVAATYQKVAQQLLGHRPDAADTAAFVNSYTQQYVANEKQNFQAQYNATVQKAQVKAAATGAAPYLPSAAPSPADLMRRGEVADQNFPSGVTSTAPSTPQGLFLQGEINDQNNPAPGGANAPTLSDSMMSLQDVINQQSQQSQQGGGGPGFIAAGTNAPEDVGVAAENFARNQHPNEAAAGDLNSTFGTFLNLIGAHMAGI
jgi:hypothetical protein